MLPSLPSIPTDSLHRFLAITGLLLMIVPTLYLSNRADTVREEVIHLKAERMVLQIQNEVIYERRKRLTILMFGQDISIVTKRKLKMINDSLNRLKRLVAIGLDSANVENKKINKLSTDIKIAKVRLDEKDEVIRFSLSRIASYTVYSRIFLVIGAAMATFGFISWYKKEKS